jgi:hypothetical protein
MMDEVQNDKIVSINFTHAAFCLIYAWFGVVWFGASYMNLRQPCIFKHQI